MPKTPTTDDIRATLQQLTTPGISPKNLLREVRKAHPKASKQEIVHAAFASLIEIADSDPDKAKDLQSFALAARSPSASEL